MKRLYGIHPMRQCADTALLAASGGDRVCLTRQERPGVYRAHCYKKTGTNPHGGWGGPVPIYESLGTWEVTIDLDTKEVLESRRVGDYKYEDFND